MKRFWIIGILLPFVFFCCTPKKSPEKPPKNERAPLVLVSLPPYQTIVEQIGGDSIRVMCVLPPKVDPHSWEPTYKDIAKFQAASIWFTVGEEFEPTLLAKLKETNANIEVVPLFESIQVDLIPSELGSETPDTHYWLDPILDIPQANSIKNILMELQPQHKALYEKRFYALREYLTTFNESLSNRLMPYSKKILVTTHGAFTYFCNQYGIEQVVIEPHEGKEPKTKDITRLIERLKVKKNDIVGVFLEPQHSNKAALLIAEQLELPTYTIDPYAPDYVTTMQTLTDAITKHGPNAN